LLDEFESYLKSGEREKLTVSVKGLDVSVAFLNELVCNPVPADPLILPSKNESVRKPGYPDLLFISRQV
jgi:hypothetical protein